MENGAENIDSSLNDDNNSEELKIKESVADTQNTNATLSESDNVRYFKREREEENLEEEKEEDEHYLHSVQEVNNNNNIVFEQESNDAFTVNNNKTKKDTVINDICAEAENNGKNGVDKEELEEEEEEVDDYDNDDDDNAEFVDMLWRTSELQALLATHRNQHLFAVATASFEERTLEKFHIHLQKILSDMTVLKEQHNESEQQHLKYSELGKLQNIFVSLLQPYIGKHISRVSLANNLLECCTSNKEYNSIAESSNSKATTTKATESENKYSCCNYEYKTNTTLHAYNTWRSCPLQQKLRNLFNLLNYECQKYNNEIRHYSTIRKTMETHMPVLQNYWTNFTTKLKNLITDSKTVLQEYSLEEELPYCELPTKKSKGEENVLEQEKEEEEELEEQEQLSNEQEEECSEEKERRENVEEFSNERKRISEDVQFVHLLQNATSLIKLPQRQEAMTQLLTYLSVLCEHNNKYITHIIPTFQRDLVKYKCIVSKLMSMIEQCVISTAQHNISVMNRCMIASYELIPYNSTKSLSEFSMEKKENEESEMVELMETDHITNCFTEYMHLLNKRSQLQLTLLVLCSEYSNQKNTIYLGNDTSYDYNSVNKQQSNYEDHVVSPAEANYAIQCKSLQKEKQELIEESVKLAREMVYVRCLQKECGALFLETKDMSRCSHFNVNNLGNANEKEEEKGNVKAAEGINDTAVNASTRLLMEPSSIVEHTIAADIIQQLRMMLTNILSYALTQLLFCYKSNKKEIKAKERTDDVVSNEEDNNTIYTTHKTHTENNVSEQVEDITSSVDTSPLQLFSEHSMSHSNNNNNSLFASEVSTAQLTYLYENVLSRSHSLYALLTENGRWREELASVDNTLHILFGTDKNEMMEENSDNVNFVESTNNEYIANYDGRNNKEDKVGKAVMEIVAEVKRAMGFSLPAASVQEMKQFEHLEEEQAMLMQPTLVHTCTNDDNEADVVVSTCRNKNSNCVNDISVRNEVLSELTALSKFNIMPTETIEENIIEKYNEVYKELMLSASHFIEQWSNECVEPVRQLCADVAFLIRLYLLQIEQALMNMSCKESDTISNYESNEHKQEVNNNLVLLLQILDNLTGKADNTGSNTSNREDTNDANENDKREESSNAKIVNENENTMTSTEEKNAATSFVNKIVPTASLLPDTATRAEEVYKPIASLFAANNTELELIRQKYATEDSSVHNLTQFVEWCSGVDVPKIETLLSTAQDANLQLELQLCVEDEAQERRTLKIEVEEAEEFEQMVCREREERESVVRIIRKNRIANRFAYLAQLENEWQELTRHNAEMERQLEELSQHQVDIQKQQEQLQELTKEQLEEEHNAFHPSELQNKESEHEHVVEKGNELHHEQVTENENSENALVNAEDDIVTQMTFEEKEEEHVKEKEQSHVTENQRVDNDREYNNDVNDEGEEVNEEEDVNDTQTSKISESNNNNDNDDVWENNLVDDISDTSNHVENSDNLDVNTDTTNTLLPNVDESVVNVASIDNVENVSHDKNDIISDDYIVANEETVADEELEKLEEEAKLTEPKEVKAIPEQADTVEDSFQLKNEEGQNELEEQEQQSEEEREEEENKADAESAEHEVVNASEKVISSPFLDDFAFDDDDDDDNEE